MKRIFSLVRNGIPRCRQTWTCITLVTCGSIMLELLRILWYFVYTCDIWGCYFHSCRGRKRNGTHLRAEIKRKKEKIKVGWKKCVGAFQFSWVKKNLLKWKIQVKIFLTETNRIQYERTEIFFESDIHYNWNRIKTNI